MKTFLQGTKTESQSGKDQSGKSEKSEKDQSETGQSRKDLIFLQLKVWIKKNICNLRTSEIPNYVSYEGKHFEGNCSGVNKKRINKNDNFYNTRQKLRVNNPLRIIVEQLNINSLRNKFDPHCSIFKQAKLIYFWFLEPKLMILFP